MLVESFWDIFLTRWNPLLTTDVTTLKLALIANRCAADDFPQGTIVTVQFGPQLGIDP